MLNKKFVILFTTILFIQLLIPLFYFNDCQAAVTPKYYVDDNAESSWYEVEGHFNTIQGAINAASPSDRIFVYEGSYTENLIINSTKSHISIFGEDKSLVTLSGGSSGNVITISATGVDISSLTIRNCGTNAENAVIKINASDCIITDNNILNSNGKNGVYIYNCSNTKIYYNSILGHKMNGIYLKNSNWNNITFSTISTNIYNGVFAYNSSNNTIDNCDIKSNSKNGVHLNMTCYCNTISNNNISSNTMNGVFLNDFCNNNIISSNNQNDGIYSNSDSGIRIENSSSNTVGNNIVNSNTYYGIMIVGTLNNIHNNSFNSNSKHGIFLFGDDNNKIQDNNIQYNTYEGIRAQNSTSDTITRNIISENFRYGIYLSYFCTRNIIYNNYFYDNTDNALDMSENNNIWSVSSVTGYNIINGANTYVAGNYWDDFDEKSEGAVDSASDGIFDSSKTINLTSEDNSPISDLIPPSLGIPTVAQTTARVGGTTTISITVTDNTQLKDVRIVITQPYSSNYSIFANKSGNSYSSSIQFSTIGTYKFKIFAKDSRNHIFSSEKTFEIHAGTAPTITDNSPETGSPSQNYIINATVTDDEDASNELTVKVDWSHGDNNGNYTMVNVYENYFQATLPLDNKTSNLVYSLWATDSWGNNVSGTQTTVEIIDNELPEIYLTKDDFSLDETLNIFSIQAEITDNYGISEASIEYWTDSNNNHLTATMDKADNNYYDKVIQLSQDTTNVYCIIYATDLAGNENDTKNPFANSGGPYIGVVAEEILFNGSESFDLDGQITNYSWDFGDGTIGDEVSTAHTYSTNGNYSISLTITDNDGNIKTHNSYTQVIQSVQVKVSTETLNQIQEDYSISLSKQFYGYDTDGDSIVDTFVDPNNVLNSVSPGNIDIENDIVFLLSVDDTQIPEFIWNTNSNQITPVSYKQATLIDYYFEDDDSSKVYSNVSTEKSTGWIYLEITDPDIGDYKTVNDVVSVSRDNISIDEDKIIRKNSKTFILDDPSVIYQIVYSYSRPSLQHASFTPSQGEINQENTTITIIYNIPVNIIYADFYSIETYEGPSITDKLITEDNRVFYYTPDPNLKSGDYRLDILAQDKDGTDEVSDEAYYEFISYTVGEEQGDYCTPLFMFIGAIFGGAIALIIFMKLKNITFESYIYIKNKKIFPFFKPIVFGPLSLDVKSENISKAEFYVNGKLKDTITKPPFAWKWDEQAFLRQKIETKVYDEEGNSSSTGDMTFFVFNNPSLFK